MVLDELTVPNEHYYPFFKIANQIKEYNSEFQPELIKVKVTQKELDRIYEQMPWKNLR